MILFTFFKPSLAGGVLRWKHHAPDYRSNLNCRHQIKPHAAWCGGNVGGGGWGGEKVGTTWQLTNHPSNQSTNQPTSDQPSPVWKFVRSSAREINPGVQQLIKQQQHQWRRRRQRRRRRRSAKKKKKKHAAAQRLTHGATGDTGPLTCTHATEMKTNHTNPRYHMKKKQQLQAADEGGCLLGYPLTDAQVAVWIRIFTSRYKSSAQEWMGEKGRGSLGQVTRSEKESFRSNIKSTAEINVPPPPSLLVEKMKKEFNSIQMWTKGYL